MNHVSHQAFLSSDSQSGTYIKIHLLSVWDLGRDEVGHDKWPGDLKKQNRVNTQSVVRKKYEEAGSTSQRNQINVPSKYSCMLCLCTELTEFELLKKLNNLKRD